MTHQPSVPPETITLDTITGNDTRYWNQQPPGPALETLIAAIVKLWGETAGSDGVPYLSPLYIEPSARKAAEAALDNHLVPQNVPPITPDLKSWAKIASSSMQLSVNGESQQSTISMLEMVLESLKAGRAAMSKSEIRFTCAPGSALSSLGISIALAFQSGNIQLE